MDLNTITVADFKAQFRRDFPYLPVYDNTKLYNAGTRVYYTPTQLFYDCKVNGTQGILPTVTNNWTLVADDVDNYVQDEDITKAFAEAKLAFNQSFFGDDDTIKMVFLYLAAVYLVNDLRAAQAGVSGRPAFAVTSRQVGNVSESYGVPDAYLDDPLLAFYTNSAYGLKYLSLVMPYLRGNIGVVCGATLP